MSNYSNAFGNFDLSQRLTGNRVKHFIVAESIYKVTLPATYSVVSSSVQNYPVAFKKISDGYSTLNVTLFLALC